MPNGVESFLEINGFFYLEILQNSLPRHLLTQMPWYLLGSDSSPLLWMGEMSPLHQMSGKHPDCGTVLNNFSTAPCISGVLHSSISFYFITSVFQMLLISWVFENWHFSRAAPALVLFLISSREDKVIQGEEWQWHLVYFSILVIHLYFHCVLLCI